jgi:hypothetical protein
MAATFGGLTALANVAGIGLGLATIIQVLRSQSFRIREIAAQTQ